MMFDSEGLWKHASNIAYYVNAAYKAMKAKNECKTNIESYMKSINRLAIGCSKTSFVYACTSISEHVKFDDSSFKDAMKYALALPEKVEYEDVNMNFKYFIALLNFHIACYKSEWKKQDEKQENEDK